MNNIANLMARLEYAWEMFMQADEHSDEAEAWFKEWKSLNDLICDLKDGSFRNEKSNSEVRNERDDY